MATGQVEDDEFDMGSDGSESVLSAQLAIQRALSLPSSSGGTGKGTALCVSGFSSLNCVVAKLCRACPAPATAKKLHCEEHNRALDNTRRDACKGSIAEAMTQAHRECPLFHLRATWHGSECRHFPL